MEKALNQDLSFDEKKSVIVAIAKQEGRILTDDIEGLSTTLCLSDKAQKVLMVYQASLQSFWHNYLAQRLSQALTVVNIDNHAYTLCRFEIEDSGASITLRNPWGMVNEGILQMDLDQFLNKVDTITCCDTTNSATLDHHTHWLTLYQRPEMASSYVRNILESLPQDKPLSMSETKRVAEYLGRELASMDSLNNLSQDSSQIMQSELSSLIRKNTELQKGIFSRMGLWDPEYKVNTAKLSSASLFDALQEPLLLDETKGPGLV